MATYKVWDQEFVFQGTIDADSDEDCMREAKIYFQIKAPIIQNMTNREMPKEL